MTAPVVTSLDVTVHGRPAPQGSKHRGAAGQLLEASKYLPAWRQAVKRAIYERYKALGVTVDQLPLLRGPVAFGATFYVAGGQRVDSPPDLDKLLRAVWDMCTEARLWEDDGRVVTVDWLSKVASDTEFGPGATFTVRLASPTEGQEDGDDIQQG